METGNIGSTIKTYLTIILAITVAVLLLTRPGCTGDNTKVTSYCRPDSVVYNTTYDTIKLVDKQIVYKPFKVKSDTVYLTKGIDSLISKETNIYDDTVRSSDVLTHYTIKTIGKLNSLNLDSKLINRKEVKIIDTIKVFHTENIITNSPPKWSLYSGINLYGSKTSFDIGPEVGLRYKNKMVDVGYNIVSQQYKFGVKIVLFNSKK